MMALDPVARQARRKQANDRYRARIGVKATPQEIICKRCGAAATVPTKRHRYCQSCSQAAADAGPSFHYYLKKPAALPLGHRICQNCGETFARRGAAQRYCGLACRKAGQAAARTEPRNRLNNRMRVGIWKTIRGKKSGRSWQRLVGYSVRDLMLHLERQFLPGMSWGNFGDWQIDHRLPLASFNYTSPDDPEFRAAWALTNLQPLWALDNVRKRAKITCLI